MSYTIYFSDPTKYSSSLSIEDNKLNVDQTSLIFVGKNASSYAQAISTNFLHLLENHASANPPNNPIEGQLWFDTSDQTNKKLRINDGTAAGANWKPINGLYQQETKPSAAASGDVWVDTSKAQLSITLDGTNWILVGPSYSSILKTGSYPDEVTDIFGTSHKIVKNYVDDQVIEIITAESFIPQQKIEGFEALKAGNNLTSANSSLYNGTALAAQNLLVTVPTKTYVTANSFLRNDVDSSVNGTLNVRQGLTIGTDPSFQIKKDTTFNNTFVSSVAGSRFKFQILNNQSYNDILTIYGGDADTIGGNKKVTIGNASAVPAVSVDLDVNGSVTIAKNVTLSSTSSVLTIAGAAVFGKSISLASTSTFSSTATFQDSILIGKSSDSTLLNPKTIINPLTNAKYNIGTSSTQFASIYAAQFVGNLQGTSLYASQLSSTATFTMSGDVSSSGISYSGLGDAKNFVTEIQASALTTKPSASASADADVMLIAVQDAYYFARDTTTNRGSGATFNVYRRGGAYVIGDALDDGIEDAGAGYIVGSIVKINGSLLGGASPANDITIKVSSISGTGAITGFTDSANRSRLDPSVNWGTPVTGINKITKKNFLKEINYQGTGAPGGVGSLVPAGSIISYAGINPPSGWLFCDGSIVTKNDYPYLYTAIGYTYGKTSLTNQFKLPDLRGRMMIGFDDMDNGSSSSLGKAYRVTSADTPPDTAFTDGLNGVVSGGSSVATITTSTPGSGGTVTGTITNVMNPYLAINYIIKT
jgi:Phage Tail Collar Domain